MGDKLDRRLASAAMDWAMRRLRITDWSVSLEVDDQPPAWAEGEADSPKICGLCKTDLKYKQAKIWLSVARHETTPITDPLSTLMHELCHVWAVDCSVRNDVSDRKELMWNTLGDLLAEHFRLLEEKRCTLKSVRSAAGRGKKKTGTRR